MNVSVRIGTREDIDALVGVERSAVDEWYHVSKDGRGGLTSYEELSTWERVMHGGSWMDATALEKYWERMERIGIMPLVAEVDGEVVGHLDIIVSEERPLGRFLFLDVLMVHKAHRRNGVASALIKEAEKIAKRKDLEFMLVKPEAYEGPSGMTYRSLGFEKAFEVQSVNMSVSTIEHSPRVLLTSIPHQQESPSRPM